MADEERAAAPLGRGSMGGARPDGPDVVARRAGDWTPTVHAWLRHLRATGVGCVPAPLGLAEDEERQARLPGVQGWHPPHPAVRTDAALHQLALWLRAAHGAAAGFVAPPDATWSSGRRGGPGPGEVVVHGDLGMWNTLWQGERLTGVVDWDLAEPAPAWWDDGNLAWAVVPVTRLAADRPPRDGWVPDQRHRLDVLASALGHPPADLLALVGDWLALQVRRRTTQRPPTPLWQGLPGRADEVDELTAQRDWVRAGADGLR